MNWMGKKKVFLANQNVVRIKWPKSNITHYPYNALLCA